MMIKKVLIIFIFTLLLFGCTKANTEAPILTEEVPIIAETHLILQQYESVDIYETIYLLSLDDLSTYAFKAPVFDSELSKSLDWGRVNYRFSESSFNNQLSSDGKHYVSHLFQSYIETRTYVESYKTADFSAYLTASFHEDMQKLEDNELTADQMFSKYGTHIIMSVRNGYKTEVSLVVESHDLQPTDFEYIRQLYLEIKPITLPIKDEFYLTYESKSNIELTVHTTHPSSSLEEVLNDLNSSNMPLTNMFEEDDLIPLHRLFGFNEAMYPNAISKLEARYNELFSDI